MNSSELIQNWLHTARKKSPELNFDLLQKICALAHQYQEENTPFSKSTLALGLEIADELLTLNCDTHTIATGILYPTLVHNKLAKEIINERHEPIIAKMLAGVKSMEVMHELSAKGLHVLEQRQVEKLRQMLLAMVDDIRIVLIKLSEQLILLDHLKRCPRELQLKIARQAMHIYAPLANRLGIGHIKWQMEDLAFRYLNPEEYLQISKALNMRRQDRDVFTHETIHTLNHLFHESNMTDLEISGRAKHIYSIYRKMHKKRVDFSEIYDTSAFRVLVPTIKDCYTALGIVHSKWQHIPKEFDDYIAKPKPNGYRSIHTVVIGPKNIHIEIQIRTHDIHEEAELGVAAHWKYKEGTSSPDGYEEKINLLREVMDWQKEVSAEEPASKQLYNKLFKDRVYIFSPKGDIYDLKNGATPLDFAYHVHSEIGHRCRGAKVNNVLVPLTHRLNTGDHVSIMTGKESHPSRDWLNPSLGYLKTGIALAKVKHWFKKQNYEENVTAGQALWEKFFRREKIGRVDLDPVAHKLNLKNAQDLFAALGAGEITPTHVQHQIKEPHEIKLTTPQETIIKPHPQRKKPSSHLYIEGVGNLLTQLAKCCKPIPGDNILGYITRGRGVSIHQRSCPNIQDAVVNKPHRIMEVQWGEKQPASYSVDISIIGNDRPGLIRDITGVIANENISIVGINTQISTAENAAYINLTIEIKSLDPLQNIMKQLRQVNDVVRVERK